jgi:hypothetical protein
MPGNYRRASYAGAGRLRGPLASSPEPRSGPPNPTRYRRSPAGPDGTLATSGPGDGWRSSGARSETIAAAFVAEPANSHSARAWTTLRRAGRTVLCRRDARCVTTTTSRASAGVAAPVLAAGSPVDRVMVGPGLVGGRGRGDQRRRFAGGRRSHRRAGPTSPGTCHGGRRTLDGAGSVPWGRRALAPHASTAAPAASTIRAHAAGNEPLSRRVNAALRHVERLVAEQRLDLGGVGAIPGRRVAYVCRRAWTIAPAGPGRSGRRPGRTAPPDSGVT